MSKIFNKKLFIVFIVFFIFLLVQNHFLWLFHDDYGYASLSYLPQFGGNRGLDTSFSDIINFLSYHYQNWGGRVLYFFFEIVLLRFGLSAFRLFQSIVTFGIFVMIFKIIKKKTNFSDYKIALFCVLCYGIFEILVFRSGIFWMTASVLYFIPLFPFLLFVYLYDGNNGSIFRNIVCGLLIFLCTWSQEQVAVLAFSYIALYTLHNWLVLKKRQKSDLVMCFCSLIGFLILYFSNGSVVRMERYSAFYEMPILLRVLKNVPTIILNNFGYYTKIFGLFFFSSSLYFIYENKKGIKFKFINDVSFLSTAVIIVLSAIFDKGYFTSMYELNSSFVYRAIVLGIFLVQLLIVFMNILYYFYKKKQYLFIYLFIGSILSQLSMLVAPYFPPRSVIMFELPCFIIFAYVFSDIIHIKKVDSKVILVPMIIIFVLNMGKITYGYYLNSSQHKYNHKELLSVGERIKNGEKIESVKLKMIVSPLYGIEQPYYDGYDYIAYYMKFYYGIPDNVEFIYE